MSASNTGRWAFEPAATPSLPIRGSDALFPVHRIYCIGRNFAAHAIASPSWSNSYQVATIGDHTFYRVQKLKPRT